MAFWKKIFKSKYTGAEIDAAIAKAGDATKVTANPTLAGTESVLTGLEVGTTKYKVDGGNIVFVGITSTESSVVCDLTLNEVSAIIDSGKQVFFDINEGESIAPGEAVLDGFGCITFMVNDSMSLLGIFTYTFDENGATGKEMIRNEYTLSLT